MKGLWTGLSVVAIANLLALLGLVGFLVSEGRLDAGRLREVRALLMDETIAEEAARVEREGREAAAAERENRFDRVPEGAPVDAGTALELTRLRDSARLEQEQRLRREAQTIRAGVDERLAVLNRERAKFEEERAAFEKRREQIRQTEGTAQFQKSLATVDGLGAEPATTLINAMLDSGERLRAVMLLNALEDRKRSAIFNQMIDNNQAALAADLLRELETLGIEGTQSEVLAGDDTP